jgi:hypothetical protein
MVTKPLFGVADAAAEAIYPSKQEALSPEAVDAELREVRVHTAERRARSERLRGYRHRWSQLTKEDVADIVVQRVRQRHAKVGTVSQHARR